MTWFSENLPSIIVGTVLLAAVALAVCVIVRNRRSGKSSCGGCCSGCAMRGQCHGEK